jgi:hypothetical protein
VQYAELRPAWNTASGKSLDGQRGARIQRKLAGSGSGKHGHAELSPAEHLRVFDIGRLSSGARDDGAAKGRSSARGRCAKGRTTECCRHLDALG